MNIELTAIEAGSLVFFSISVVGVVMALRLRSRRKKKRQVKQDVEEFEFKANPETLAPEKVVKENLGNQQSEEQKQDEQKHIDPDALLKDLQKDSEEK